MQVSQGAKMPGSGDAASSGPPECRCDGSGTYTVSIPLADAVVSDERQCPGHGQSSTPAPAALLEPPPVGSIARDTRTGHVGKVMPRVMAGLVRISSLPVLVTLRPVAGGLEWDVPIQHVERLDAVPEQP